MEIDHPWGQETIIEKTGHCTVRMLSIYPGFRTPMTSSAKAKRIYVVEGYVTVQNKTYCGGTAFNIPATTNHIFRADADAFGCKIIEITR